MILVRSVALMLTLASAVACMGCASRGLDAAGPVDEADDALDLAAESEDAPEGWTAAGPEDATGKPEPDPWKKTGTAQPTPTEPSLGSKPEPDPWTPGSTGSAHKRN